MNRTQIAALVAGATLGAAGVAIAVVLSRKEGREAAERILEKSKPVAEQAKTMSERAAKSAIAGYQTLAPKATEVWSTAREKAPQAVTTFSSRLPRFAQNGKHDAMDVLQ